MWFSLFIMDHEYTICTFRPFLLRIDCVAYLSNTVSFQMQSERAIASHNLTFNIGIPYYSVGFQFLESFLFVTFFMSFFLASPAYLHVWFIWTLLFSTQNRTARRIPYHFFLYYKFDIKKYSLIYSDINKSASSYQQHLDYITQKRPI